MTNAIVRYLIGEDKKPKLQPATQIEQPKSNELELGERRLRQMQLKGMQMGMDEVLTRMAIGQVVSINDMCQQVAGGDKELLALISPLQQAHAQRLASYLKGE